MKQHFFLIVFTAFIATTVASLVAKQFIDLPSLHDLLSQLTATPDTQENYVSSNI